MDRLRNREPAKVTVKESTNPITGKHTVTTKTQPQPKGIGHHGHGGRGPLASTTTPTANAGRTTAGTTRTRAPATRSQRTPGVDNKVGTMTKLKGALTGKPGVNVSF